ncbi:hypothetical protein [Flavobacterium sp. SM2513]|uniref:hypothetical protein n=1 Tax=Flavobacterium sp. SM2513 TaxID=3424766 RepID=UPI003D7FE1AF
MKKILFTLLFSSSFGFAQEIETDKFQIHSISVSPIGFYASQASAGFGANADVAVNYGKNIFKLYANGGSEFVINTFGASIYDSYEEYGILYGRTIQLKSKVDFDYFAGLSFFKYTSNNNSSASEYDYYYEPNAEESVKKVIGVPLQAKLRFKLTRVFSLGLQLHTNINTATSIFQPGFFVQFKL